MASNWVIVIGINQYRFLQPLKYAKRDAELMQAFLMQEAGFDRIFLFTDDSPEIGGKPTEPLRANLLRVLRQIFETPFMKDGDNFWFFFSGHGIPHNGQDYLMPLDGDPEDVENTGISTNTITNYLRSCGADNAVMILDACRSGGKKSGEGIGRQTEAEARQTGVISLFSCSPEQYSYELEAIEQGAFTYALLEGLGIRGKCATVERLNQYLEHRVPELISQHLGRGRQTPYTIAEPLSRSHLILMPQHASLGDIATLKNDAYRAQMKQDWDLAQRLWIRVNAAASGRDMEAIEALQNLGAQRSTPASPVMLRKIAEPSQTSMAKLRLIAILNFLSNFYSNPKWKILRITGLLGGIIVLLLLDKRIPQPSPSSNPSMGASPLPSSSPIQHTNYESLENFLANREFIKADEETSKILLQITGNELKGYNDQNDVKKINCSVYRRIDDLWTEYSKAPSGKSKFGFSVQRNIWINTGSNSKESEKFGERVGWYRNNAWLTYRDLNNDAARNLTEIPAGYLPSRYRYTTSNHSSGSTDQSSSKTQFRGQLSSGLMFWHLRPEDTRKDCLNK